MEQEYIYEVKYLTKELMGAKPTKILLNTFRSEPEQLSHILEQTYSSFNAHMITSIKFIGILQSL